MKTDSVDHLLSEGDSAFDNWSERDATEGHLVSGHLLYAAAAIVERLERIEDLLSRHGLPDAGLPEKVESGLVTPDEARKLSGDVDVSDLLRAFKARVRGVAAKGERSVAHPFHGAENLSSKRVAAALRILENAGYDVTVQKGYPDSPDPRERADVDVVSW